MSASNQGIMSRMGGMLEKLTDPFDRPKNPVAHKAARIFFDVIVIGLGIGIFFAVTKGGHIGALMDPSLSTMMSMPMYLGLTGFGISMLLQDIIGRKHHRTCAKIAAYTLAFFLAAGATCLLSTGFIHGLTPNSLDNYFMVGIILIPLSFFALNRAINLSGNEPTFVNGPPPTQIRRRAPTNIRRPPVRAQGRPFNLEQTH